MQPSAAVVGWRDRAGQRLPPQTDRVPADLRAQAKDEGTKVVWRRVEITDDTQHFTRKEIRLMASGRVAGRKAPPVDRSSMERPVAPHAIRRSAVGRCEHARDGRIEHEVVADEFGGIEGVHALPTASDFVL